MDPKTDSETTTEILCKLDLVWINNLCGKEKTILDNKLRPILKLIFDDSGKLINTIIL